MAEHKRAQQLPTQAKLAAFLRDPRSYPDHPRTVSLHQTHASYLVLTKRYAYKVKKPVKLGFLDFSTLEKRRYFCEREVMLNQRLCPGLHRGVVPISIENGKLSFGAAGRPVEYAVKMHRLPERDFMLRHIERGGGTAHEVEAIVAVLKYFYEHQPSNPEIAQWGRVAKLRITTDENFRQTRQFVGVTITPAAFEAVQAFTRCFYRCRAGLFRARCREGRILDGHGDLHLEHIHLGRARLTIYDCIEFNDRFRYIDVANDVAFLAMDLDFHGRPDLARHFSTRMARALGDPGLQPLLPFYLCGRAYVRGKVESLKQCSPGISAAEQRSSREQAGRYFRLALRYAVGGTDPMVLIVMGGVASGKSTLARALGAELGWPVFSSDRIRKGLAGAAFYRRGGERQRRRLYAKGMTARTYAALARLALEHIRQQHGAILDATFASRHRRDLLRRLLKRARMPYCFLEARSPAGAVKLRLKRRARAQNEVSDARLEDLPLLRRAYEPPVELPRESFLAVNTGRPCEAAVAAALKALARRNARRQADCGSPPSICRQ